VAQAAMNAMNRKPIRLFALVIIVSSLLYCSSDSYGAIVTVQNIGSTPLHSVLIGVTADTYSIGELTALETRTVKTYPTGESHIVIEHIDESGQKKELAVDCYFEAGCRSRIKINVRGETATRAE
jgi:hypothetical protein